MKTKTRLFVVFVAVASPRPADAYCLSSVDVPNFDAGPIPVYLSNGLSTSVREVGLEHDNGDDRNGRDIEERWIRAAIEIINSASAASPPLYFAGYDGSVGPTYLWSDLHAGITIATWTCASQAANAIAGQSAFQNKALIRMRAGGDHACNSGCDWDMDPTSCFSWYVDPDERSIQDTDHDFLGTVVHELLHALGLNHTNFDRTEWPQYCTNPYNPTVASVMNVSTSQFSRDWRHRLRRDDIEGLRALYGAPDRSMFSRQLTIGDGIRASWTSAVAMGPNMRTNTPVALSSATTSIDDEILAGFTDNTDRFRYLTGGWSGWSVVAVLGGVHVPSDLADPIEPVEKVGVAQGVAASGGARRRLFAWVGGLNGANENVMEAEVRIRWRVREGNTWLPSYSTGPTHYKNFGVSYDPRSDQFVLAYADTYPNGSNDPADQYLFVRTISASNGSSGCTQAFTTLPNLHVYEIGDVNCDFSNSTNPTSCVIPVSSLSDDGPRLQYVQGTIDTFSGYQCFVKDPVTPLWTVGEFTFAGNTLHSYGSIGGAMEGNAWGGAGIVLHQPSDVLVSYAPQLSTGGEQIVRTIQRDGNGMTTLLGAPASFSTGHWPLRLGSISSLVSPPGYNRWFMITY